MMHVVGVLPEKIHGVCDICMGSKSLHLTMTSGCQGSTWHADINTPSGAVTITSYMNRGFHCHYMHAVSGISDSVNADDAKASLGVTVTMNITNIGTQGYPGTGKTSILDLAMGKEPAFQRNSTSCIDPPSRYMLINSEVSTAAQLEWENVTTDRMFEMVCGAVKKTIEESRLDKVLLYSDKPTAATLPVAVTSSLPVNNSVTEYIPTFSGVWLTIIVFVTKS